MTGPGGIEIVILDRADGAVRRVSKPLSLPVWVRPSLDDSPEFALRAEIHEQSVIIRWSAQARYLGGAPPSAEVRESYEHDAQGAARVALETGDIELLDEPIDSTAVSLGTARSTAEPDVVEQQEIGDKFFQLVAQVETGGTVKVLLRGIERKSGKTVWQRVTRRGAAASAQAAAALITVNSKTGVPSLMALSDVDLARAKKHPG